MSDVDRQILNAGPRLIEGARNIDDRGVVAFVNDFTFAGVKRFYLVTNHRAGFVRAWHAHRREAKYVTVTRGAAVLAAVKIDDWETPSAGLEVHRFVMAAENPAVLYIPAGHANGFMSLTKGATLMFFSTSTLEESRGDDVRYDSRYWNVWNVVER